MKLFSLSSSPSLTDLPKVPRWSLGKPGLPSRVPSMLPHFFTRGTSSNGNVTIPNFPINSKIISHLMLVMFESFPTKGLSWKRLILYVSPFKLLFQGWFYLEWEEISVYLEQFHLEDISIFLTTTPFLCSVFLAHCFLFWHQRSCSL